MSHSRQLFCLLSLALFCIGCGGGETPPAEVGNPVSDVNNTSVAPRAVSVQPRVPGVRRSTTTSPRTGYTPSEMSDLPEGVSPEDVFEVSPSENTFEVAASAEQLSTFTIIAKPLAGADSGTFENPRSRLTPSESGTVQKPIRQEVGGTPNSGRFPAEFIAAPGSTIDETSGLPTRIVSENDKSELVLIPAGTTIRGSNHGPANARPEHQVYLDDYYISVHEVTLEQYHLYREAKLAETRSRPVPEALNSKDAPTMPALGVAQLEARKFAEWVGGQLPTEAQWEKAARGPQGFKYPWGNGRPIWPQPRDPRELSPVMSYLGDISMYGVYDLAGNAQEWTLDVYQEDTFQKEAGEEGQVLLENPSGPKAGAGAYSRVIKGGDDWKSWNRSGARFSEKLPQVGFRYVVPIMPAEPDSAEGGESQTGSN